MGLIVDEAPTFQVVELEYVESSKLGLRFPSGSGRLASEPSRHVIFRHTSVI